MSFIRQFISLGLQVVAVVYFPSYALPLLLASAAVSAYDARREAKKQERDARDAYNASLADRLEMVDLRADAPRTLVLGRTRAVEGIRRRWVSGDNSEKLTMVVSYAGHEVDAFEAWYADDVLLTLDGNGWVQTAPYYRTSRTHEATNQTLNGSGELSYALSPSPASGTVKAVWRTGTGGSIEEGQCTVVMTGDTANLSGGQAGASVYITWESDNATSYLRIRPYTGTAAQNVGADLASEYPGKITSAERFAGIALAVIDMVYDPDAFPQGRPNITAVMRGAKVYDPRADSTQSGGSGAQRLADSSTWTWSENPALLAYHYARHANGWAVPADEIATADVMAAATACDVSTDFTLRMPDDSTEEVTLPRYRAGTVVATDSDPREAMDALTQSMAGRWGWAGGRLRLRAGAMGSTVWALDASWVAQRLDENGEPSDEPVVRVRNGVAREQRITRVSGTCVHPDERWQTLAFPAVEDAALIAADGAPYSVEVRYGAVTHPAHAQHLGTLAIKQGQAPLRMDALCNLSAYRLELFDVGTVTLERFGFSAKTFEVIGWRWHPAEGVALSLAEITAAMFEPEAELTGQDPAPNSTLRNAWSVQTLTGLAVESATPDITDGSILTRTRITWDAATQQSVIYGGRIEVQYREVFAAVPAGDWASWIEPGSATEAVIAGLAAGRYYVFRARAVQPLPLVHGAWSATVLHKVTEPALIDTDKIAPNATTVVTSDEYDFAGAGAGGSGYTVRRTVSVTPARDCVVEFAANATAKAVYPDGGNNLEWWAVRSGESDLPLGYAYFGSTTSYGTAQAFKSFAATAGVQIDFELRTRAASGTSVQLWQTQMMVTEVRR